MAFSSPQVRNAPVQSCHHREHRGRLETIWTLEQASRSMIRRSCLRSPPVAESISTRRSCLVLCRWRQHPDIFLAIPRPQHCLADRYSQHNHPSETWSQNTQSFCPLHCLLAFFGKLLSIFWLLIRLNRVAECHHDGRGHQEAPSTLRRKKLWQSLKDLLQWHEILHWDLASRLRDPFRLSGNVLLDDLANSYG